MPTPTPLPQSVDASSSIVLAEDGRVNGATDRFTPAYGDTTDGAQGQTVDGNLTCAYPGGEPQATNYYHVNVWLGFFVNGQEVAPARGMGMVNPQPPALPDTVIEQAQCLYQIHNHDYSGTVHIEDTTQPPSTAARYTLQQLFDVWGNGPRSSHWPFTGNVTVYAGTPTSTCCNGNDIVGRYSRIDDYPSLPLSKHTVIWIIVGPLPSAGLPQVEFTMQA